MRLALRALVAAAALAVPAVSATPADAAICFEWTSQEVYDGIGGKVTAPLPKSIDPNCTVTAILEFVP